MPRASAGQASPFPTRRPRPACPSSLVPARAVGHHASPPPARAVSRRFPHGRACTKPGQPNPAHAAIHASLPSYTPRRLRFARPLAHCRSLRPKQPWPTRTRWPDPPRRMRRDAVAAAPTAAGASPPITSTVLPVDAVVIDVPVAPRPAEVPGGVGCRICHLGPEDSGSAAPGSEVIQLGCGCKDELGAAHRQCAEAWFRIKGDRRCEICGSDAKNITGLEVKKFMEQWHGRRVANIQAIEERESHCWRQKPFCNFLLASLLIVFMLPWFLRVNLF